MPTRRPAACAAALAARTTRRCPSRPTRTSGVSGGGAEGPIARRNRSVGQVGRKSETTRFIARFQDELRAFSGAAADQLDEPARPADPRHRERLRPQPRDPPPPHAPGRLPAPPPPAPPPPP